MVEKMAFVCSETFFFLMPSQENNLSRMSLQLTDTCCSLVLLALTGLTLIQSMIPPRTTQRGTQLTCAMFVSLFATLHYSLLSYHPLTSHRILLRFVDWIVTAPLIRCQALMIESKRHIQTTINKVYITSQVFMVLSLWAELSPWVFPRHVCFLLSLFAAQISASIDDGHSPKATRAILLIMAVYTIVYVMGFLVDGLRDAREHVFVVLDTTTKTVFVTWLILNDEKSLLSRWKRQSHHSAS